MNIQVGDTITTAGGRDWEVTTRPGFHQNFPKHWGVRCIKYGLTGLVVHSQITHINGNPVGTKPIDLERLKTDRAYWHEVAPEDAVFFGIEDGDWRACWYKGVDSNFRHMLDPASLNVWEITEIMHPADRLIARPTVESTCEWVPVIGQDCRTSGGPCVLLGLDKEKGVAAVQWISGELGVIKVSYLRPPSNKK